MGFLDHSTNNIILDAVLTDKGREFLARNDRSFSIAKFALGDDEVNYKNIQKYGRTVGREKIEKNTPVFEALTNQSISQKHKLISVANPRLTYMPQLYIEGPEVITMTRNSASANTRIVIEQRVGSASNTSNLVEPELMDNNYIIEVPHVFFQINNSVPSVDAYQKAIYTMQANAGTNNVNGTRLNFILTLKSIPDSTWQIYDAVSGNTLSTINTYIKVTGVSSGAVKDIPVLIKPQ